ncbi:MAG: outer membrane beta-barrel domain-containing protein [Desulfuromonadales bacterium]
MKNSHVLLCLAFALLTALVPGRSDAAIRPNTLNLSPFVGYYIFEGNQHLDNAPIYGLAVGYNFTERWGFEGMAGYINTDADKSTAADNVDMYNVSLNALYHFQPNRELVPYVAAGLGWMGFHPGEKSGGNEERALFNYGVGLKYFLTDDIALRADVRHILTDGDWVDSDQVFNNLSCTFGLTFQLGPFSSPSTASKAPAAVWDTDGDGVPDTFDRCPDTRPGSKVDGYGCPPVTAPAKQ